MSEKVVRVGLSLVAVFSLMGADMAPGGCGGGGDNRPSNPCAWEEDARPASCNSDAGDAAGDATTDASDAHAD